MIGWVDVLALVFALALAALGVWRGLLREILVTLAGIVLGVVLGGLWSTTWAASSDARTQGIIRLASLLFIVLFIGYGSALLLRRRSPAWWQRLAGGVVGFFNGVLLTSFSFQYIQEYFVRGPSVLGNSLTYRIATVGLSWVFVIIVVAVWLAVVVIGLVRVGRFIMQLAQPPAGEVVAPPPPAAAAAPPPVEPAVPPVEPIQYVPSATEEPGVPCPNCGTPVPPGAAYCPQCGKVIS